jgi:AraC-like DNA-binding protein/mannose-6-phosphate isomerase-like protein (cupin superfamily)
MGRPYPLKPDPAALGRSEVRRWRLFELEQVRHRRLGQEWAPHWHPEWSIGAVVQGECLCTVGGRPMRARPGDVMAIAPNVVHTGALMDAAGMGPVLVTMIYVPASWFERAELPPPAGTGWVSAPALASASADLHTAHDVRRWLAEAVGILSKLEPVHGPGAGPGPAEGRLLGKVNEALLEGHVTVALLARCCGVSRERLHRVLRRWTGMSPADYCRAIRVNRARAMLLGGNRLSDTAIACGFADQAHFTRWFRRAFGYTPGDLLVASRRGSSSAPVSRP